MKVLRIAVVALLLVSMLLTLCACGKFNCATCREEKSGKRYKEEFLGKEILICKDCHEKGEELNDIVQDIGDLFN